MKQFVYISDEENVWILGQVVQEESNQVSVAVGPEKDIRTYELSSPCVLPTEVCDVNINNLCDLPILNEATMLEALEKRFNINLPYTYANDVCIAINPYKRCVEQEQSLRLSYLTTPKDQLPPHVYTLSSAAYKGIYHSRKNQTIIVNGESGAGKTESVKLLLSHLAELSAYECTESLSRMVFGGNTVLESFGNAATTRNDNSSRFGKYLSLQFNNSATLISSQCSTYLLEKSRLVHQASASEKNFHIIYELLYAPEKVRCSFGLGGKSCGDFHYLAQSSSITESQMREYQQRFAGTDKALGDLLHPMSPDLQLKCEVFSIVAACLQLGEIICSSGLCDEDPQLAICASLLGVQADALLYNLKHRLIRVGGAEIPVPLTPEQSMEARDALAKELYARMFDWLVRITSNPLQSESSVQCNIALLDIFGFESFPANHFEQLCINYANEKLQCMFAHDVIVAVQTEYAAQGIHWTAVPFSDNSAVIELIEGRMGLLDLLNEECMVPKGCDASFLSKLIATHKRNDIFSTDPSKHDQFTIAHYADKVTYHTEHFVEKNKDTIQINLVSLLVRSDKQLVQKLFLPTQVEQSGNSRRPFSTSTKFQVQLHSLVRTIAQTSVHYIRCIKPNAVMRSDYFDRRQVVRQLRCGGLVEAAKVARDAFPNKLPHIECLLRFRLLLRGKECIYDGAAAACSGLLDRLLPTASFQVGYSQVYFSAGALKQLDALVQETMAKYAVRLQAVARMWLCRMRLKIALKAAVKVQACVRMIFMRHIWMRRIYAVKRLQTSWRAFIERKRHARLCSAYKILKHWLSVRCQKTALSKLRTILPSSAPLLQSPEPSSHCKAISAFQLTVERHEFTQQAPTIPTKASLSEVISKSEWSDCDALVFVEMRSREELAKVLGELHDACFPDLHNPSAATRQNVVVVVLVSLAMVVGYMLGI